DELVAMLAAWVAEARPDAVGSGSAGTAAPVTGVIAGTGPGVSAPDEPTADEPTADESTADVVPLRSGRHRATFPYARRLGIAAALIALATSGVAVGASEAEPGSVLWP